MSNSPAEVIESIMEQLTFTSGVLGVVICNSEGIPIRDSFSDMDRSQAINYAAMAADLVKGAEKIVAKDGGLDTLRVRTTQVEVFVKASPQYLLVVVQDPTTQQGK